MLTKLLAVTVVLGGLAATFVLRKSSGPKDAPEVARVTAALKAAFPEAPPDWGSRLAQDETMKVCSDHRNSPPKAAADGVAARESALIIYPADGNYLGSWKNGERLAQSGYGLRFTDILSQGETGGNCYACHQLTDAEVSYGTIGGSLRAYGKIRQFRQTAAKTAYEKIYNSHAAAPCSLMPRFGANGLLTLQQIKDLVALLMDPESPVNQ